MTIRKTLIASTFLAAFCLSGSSWLHADTNQVAAPDDKMGGKTDTHYGSDSATNAPNGDTSKQSQTVPSGKRHRTHKKHGNKAEDAGAQKTINSGDVTPSK